MTTQSKSKYSLLVAKLARPLVSAGLIVGGFFQMVSPVLALGTAAGEQISNTATATFEDPDGNTRTTTSNTVVVTIAEVAGLTNVAQTPIDVNSASVVSGDTVRFPFLVTNTGNSETGIYVPTVDGVVTSNLDPDTVLIYIDIDNDGTDDYVVDKSGNAIPASTGTNALFAVGALGTELANSSTVDGPVAATNGDIAVLGDSYIVTDDGAGTAGIDADASIVVTIEGDVADGLISGALIDARLGNTGSNNSSNPDSQNIPDVTDASNTNEIRTIDEDNGGAAADIPVNGEREAADTAPSLVLGTAAPQPLALATVKKVAQSVDDNGTVAFTDDVITYNLSLSVANDLPLNYAENYVPANLVGTLGIDVDGDGGVTPRILVSDAVPAETVLDAATPLAPSGWTIVYTTDALTIAPTDAAWSTTRSGTITRVGYVYTGTIATNTEITGFEFYALANGSIDTGDVDGDTNDTETTPIYNIAQVFGQSQGDGGNNTVFDESGDQAPNNFFDTDGDGDLDPPEDADNADTPDPYGEYDPTNDDEDLGDPSNPAFPTNANADTGNNNTGAGTDGEPNKLELGTPPTPPAPGNLKNGPLNQAAATGAIGDNDDFTNKGIADGVTNGANVNPNAFLFNNSLRNVSGVDLDNVILRPISPTTANQVCTSCIYEEDTLLPDTIVTINVPAVLATGTQPAIAAQTAEYTWSDPDNDTVFDFILTDGATIEIPTLSVGFELDYTVSVDLPPGPSFQGYSIPLVGYVDNNGNDAFDPTLELINNITIDTLYTGYLRLSKEARILYADGTTSPFFTTDPASVGATAPAPGDRIQYRITYENISSAAPATGANNNVLPANSVVVIENGVGDDALARGNNWALDNDRNGIIDTQNVTGSAVADVGTIQYFNGDPAVLGIDQSGSTAAADVTQYTNTVGTVNPGESGTFSFQREVQ